MLTNACSTSRPPPPSTSPSNRDQRPERRPLRVDRDRRGPGRRRRAARGMGLARERRDAAGARHPALHGDLAGDGERGAAAGGGAPAAGEDAPRARAGGPQRAVRRARAAPGVRAGRVAVARPAGDLHGPDGAAVRAAAAEARTRALAGALGVEVHEVHRALPTRARARRSSARCSGACARTRRPSATRSRCSARGRCGPGRPRCRTGRAANGPISRRCRTSPGVYIFRDADGKPLYVGKSVDLRVRARSHSPRRVVDAAGRARGPHGDRERARRAAARGPADQGAKPPGNVRGKADPDGYVYIRCRLDIPFPILEVAREPAAGHAVCVGPVRGRAAAAELVEQLNSLFGLRHCGRSMPRREHPSAYGQMGRCLSPCLNDLDPNVYRERLDAALRLFVGRSGGEALLARVDEQIAEASAAQRYERAAWLRAPARAAGVAAGAARRRSARDPHGRAVGAGAAPVGAGASTRSGSRAGAWWIGARWTAPRSLARSARAFAEAPPPGGSAGGCRPRRSPRRGWSGGGSWPTRRLLWNWALA